MKSSTQRQFLIGTWSGTSRLWLSPDQAPLESASTAEIAPLCQGQFLRISYTWESEGQPQDGLIIFGASEDSNSPTSVWLDSWHMARQIMVCGVAMVENGVIKMTGTYAAPPGPDWGWRIEIETVDQDACVVRMFNISPEGDDALAVLAEYERQ